VRSLALSPDGTTLYAVNDRGAVAELSMAGGSVTATFDPNIAHPIALMRVEALA
jgi:DNA-binding beta-propeller fold protein YncE